MLFVGGTGVVEVRQGNALQAFRVDVERVGDIWRERVAERPRLVAALQTSPEAPYGAMVDVLDQLHGAGARRIALQLDDR
jgi:biopolymer transport protein ExbD